MFQIKKCSKLKNIPNFKTCPKYQQYEKCPKLKKTLVKHKWLLNGTWACCRFRSNAKAKARRPTFCLVRFAFARRSSLFCVPDLFLYLCLLCGSMCSLGPSGSSKGTLRCYTSIFDGIFPSRFQVVFQPKLGKFRLKNTFSQRNVWDRSLL